MWNPVFDLLIDFNKYHSANYENPSLLLRKKTAVFKLHKRHNKITMDKIKGSLSYRIYVDILYVYFSLYLSCSGTELLAFLHFSTCFPFLRTTRILRVLHPKHLHMTNTKTRRRIKSCCSHQRTVTQWQHLCGEKRSNKHSCTDSIVTEPEQHLRRN